MDKVIKFFSLLYCEGNTPSTQALPSLTTLRTSNMTFWMFLKTMSVRWTCIDCVTRECLQLWSIPIVGKCSRYSPVPPPRDPTPTYLFDLSSGNVPLSFAPLLLKSSRCSWQQWAEAWSIQKEGSTARKDFWDSDYATVTRGAIFDLSSAPV